MSNVKTAEVIGDPDLGGARANGRFVIVSLELTNRKDEPKAIPPTTSGSSEVTATNTASAPMS